MKRVVASKGQFIVNIADDESMAQISATKTPTRHIYFAVFKDGESQSCRAFREEHFGSDVSFDAVDNEFLESDVYHWESRSAARS